MVVPAAGEVVSIAASHLNSYGMSVACCPALAGFN